MLNDKTPSPPQPRATWTVVALAWLTSTASPVLAKPPLDPSGVASATRPDKIRELVADLGYGADITHVDAAVPYLTAQVAPSDPNWTRANPRWGGVSAQIGSDLHTDVQTQFAEPEAAIVENAVHAMSDGVVREDLDAALTFFRSPVGHRFLYLQDSLMNLSIEVNLARATAVGAPSVENLDARRRVLSLWLPIQFLRAMFGPEAADRALDSAYRSFGLLRGPQLDSLAQSCAEDMPQFEQFLTSASFRRIVEAEKSSEKTLPEPDLSTFFDAEQRQHAAAWRAAYRGP